MTTPRKVPRTDLDAPFLLDGPERDPVEHAS
jgi:hypothetical protein